MNRTAVKLSKPGSRNPVWWSGNINDEGSLRYMEKIPGVNEAIGYIGSLCSFLGLHVEDDGLAIVSYIHSGALKVWYVFRSSAFRGVLVQDNVQRFFLEPVPWFSPTVERCEGESLQPLHLRRRRVECACVRSCPIC